MWQSCLRMLRMVSEAVFGVWALGDSLLVFCHLELKGECCLGLLSLLFEMAVHGRGVLMHISTPPFTHIMHPCNHPNEWNHGDNLQGNDDDSDLIQEVRQLGICKRSCSTFFLENNNCTTMLRHSLGYFENIGSMKETKNSHSKELVDGDRADFLDYDPEDYDLYRCVETTWDQTSKTTHDIKSALPYISKLWILNLDL